MMHGLAGGPVGATVGEPELGTPGPAVHRHVAPQLHLAQPGRARPTVAASAEEAPAHESATERHTHRPGLPPHEHGHLGSMCLAVATVLLLTAGRGDGLGSSAGARVAAVLSQSVRSLLTVSPEVWHRSRLELCVART